MIFKIDHVFSEEIMRRRETFRALKRPHGWRRLRDLKVGVQDRQVQAQGPLDFLEKQRLTFI